jgi:hypothetical protein
MRPVWNEHLDFEFKDIGKSDVEGATLKVEVKDRNTLHKDALIGTFEMDLLQIYFMPDHEVGGLQVQ